MSKLITLLSRILTVVGLLVTFFLITPTQVQAALVYYESYISTSGSKRILVFIDTSIYPSLINSVEFHQWVSDLEAENYFLKIVEIISGTEAELRDYIVSEYNLNGLEGTIMIGDLPYATYEKANTFGRKNREVFPIDLFFMDLNGVWQDIDGDEYYDSHTGDRGPEIWLGRIKTSTLNYDSTRDEIGKIKFYLDKTHHYRNRNLYLNKRALSYHDDDWSSNTTIYLDSIYEEVVVVNDKQTTSAADYQQRLSENYEWIHVSAHSTPTWHTFNTNSGWDRVWYYDVVSIDPLTSFYNLFACSNAKYSHDNYLAGHYVFNRTYGLVAVGSTKIGSMLNYFQFYSPLGEEYKWSIGEAFKNWFRNQNLDYENYRDWFYGMTIIGDPTLVVNYPSPSPTPTPTPTEVGYQIILNSATGKSCNEICGDAGLTCSSAGWDSDALNGKAHLFFNQKCYDYTIPPGQNCTTKMMSLFKTCSGHETSWTNCRCETSP
jgi:hypothetical protein